jgi:hypothetical protein
MYSSWQSIVWATFWAILTNSSSQPGCKQGEGGAVVLSAKTFAPTYNRILPENLKRCWSSL